MRIILLTITCFFVFVASFFSHPVYADEDLGQMYLEQAKKIKGLPLESLSLYINAAKKNNLEAQLTLIKFYETGRFSPEEYIQRPDLRRACIWAYFASQNNDNDAIEKLPILKQAYLLDPHGTADKGGYEVKKEITSTEDLIKLANKGQLDAQIDLGYRYLLGINVKEDRVAGLFWLFTFGHSANFQTGSLSQIYVEETFATTSIFNDLSSQNQLDNAQKLSKKWIAEFNKKNPQNNIFQAKEELYKKEKLDKANKAQQAEEATRKDKINAAKIKCTELGYIKGSDRFNKCVLEIFQ